jgi:hypothetical protein
MPPPKMRVQPQTLGEMITASSGSGRIGSAQDLMVRLATGLTPAQLYEVAARGGSQVPWTPDRPDLAVHGLAAQLMAERLGPTVASLTGTAKETVQGVGSLLRGQGFYGEHGFDQNDLAANERGVSFAEDELAGRKLDVPKALITASASPLPRYGGY